MEEYLVKLNESSYRDAVWVSKRELERAAYHRLRAYLTKGAPSLFDGQSGLKSEYLRAERVLDRREGKVLVKWRGLDYTQATWEFEIDFFAGEGCNQNGHPGGAKAAAAEAAQALAEYEARCKGRPKLGNPPSGKAAVDAFLAAYKTPATTKGGRELHDYQVEGVRWLLSRYLAHRNCVLADEMGLGKTAQTVQFLSSLASEWNVTGPFLVVAPVSTLGHWEREVRAWSQLDVVTFVGTRPNREAVVYHEWYPGGMRTKAEQPRLQVVVTSYEALRADDPPPLGMVKWRGVVVDEAHRLKGIDSATRYSIDALYKEHLLLLTGTPIQNNSLELFSLLNLLDPQTYYSDEVWARQYGEVTTAAQVENIRKLLKPLLLRRVKEDVMGDGEIPAKEEVLVNVELTPAQRAWYKALLEGSVGALIRGKNLPALRNTCMQLRKVCNHPFNIEGARFELEKPGAAGVGPDPLVSTSGKMVFLAKMLPKLRAEGSRVLIFSQFTMQLDLIQEYLKREGMRYERLDGNVSREDRDAAMARFQAAQTHGDDSAPFVFILSTRAGGLGITLTAADTAIIYDSDWNPQNDLQAMARCHRIGQTKEVTIYRLLTTNTYESRLFEVSSKKQGLDDAILGDGAVGADGSESADALDKMLREGAYAVLTAGEEADKEAATFANESVEEMLSKRTSRRVLDNDPKKAKGNTFSVATFAMPEDKLGKSSRGFWDEMLPEAVATADEQRAAEMRGDHLITFGKRERKQVQRIEMSPVRGRAPRRGRDDAMDMDVGSDSDFEDRAVSMAARKWSKANIKTLEARLLSLGFGRAAEVAATASLPPYVDASEAETVVRALEACVDKAAEGFTRKPRSRRGGGDKKPAATAEGSAAEVSAADGNAPESVKMEGSAAVSVAEGSSGAIDGAISGAAPTGGAANGEAKAGVAAAAGNGTQPMETDAPQQPAATEGGAAVAAAGTQSEAAAEAAPSEQPPPRADAAAGGKQQQPETGDGEQPTQVAEGNVVEGDAADDISWVSIACESARAILTETMAPLFTKGGPIRASQMQAQMRRAERLHKAIQEEEALPVLTVEPTGKKGEKPDQWWTTELDHALMRGANRHGVKDADMNAIRNDKTLPFRELFGAGVEPAPRPLVSKIMPRCGHCKHCRQPSSKKYCITNRDLMLAQQHAAQAGAKVEEAPAAEAGARGSPQSVAQKQDAAGATPMATDKQVSAATEAAAAPVTEPVAAAEPKLEPKPELQPEQQQAVVKSEAAAPPAAAPAAATEGATPPQQQVPAVKIEGTGEGASAGAAEQQPAADGVDVGAPPPNGAPTAPVEVKPKPCPPPGEREWDAHKLAARLRRLCETLLDGHDPLAPKPKAPPKPKPPPKPKAPRKPKDPNAPPKPRKPKDPNAPPKPRKPKDPNAPPKERKPKKSKRPWEDNLGGAGADAKRAKPPPLPGMAGHAGKTQFLEAMWGKAKASGFDTTGTPQAQAVPTTQAAPAPAVRAPPVVAPPVVGPPVVAQAAPPLAQAPLTMAQASAPLMQARAASLMQAQAASLMQAQAAPLMQARTAPPIQTQAAPLMQAAPMATMGAASRMPLGAPAPPAPPVLPGAFRTPQDLAANAFAAAALGATVAPPASVAALTGSNAAGQQTFLDPIGFASGVAAGAAPPAPATRPMKQKGIASFFQKPPS